MKKLLMLSLAFFAFACGGPKKADLGEVEVNVPSWFMTPPASDDAVYGTARQESKDMQIAVNKAKQEATVDLTKKLEVKVKGMTKKFAEEVGALAEDATIRNFFEDVSKVVVNQTVNGIEVKEQKIMQSNKNGVNVYVVYILMEMRFDAANKILMSKIKAQEEIYTKLQASKSFKELEAEIEKMDAK